MAGPCFSGRNVLQLSDVRSYFLKRKEKTSHADINIK